MSGMLARVGASAARRPWRVVVGLVVLLMLLGGVAGGVGAGYSDEVRLGNTDSQRASDLLTERFPAASGDTATLVFHSDEGVARDPSVEVATAEVAQQPDVGSVTPLQVSPDGTTGYVTVLYTEKAADLSEAHLNRLEQAVEPLDAAGVEASMRGPVVDRWRERPMPVGEVVGILAAVILVTLLFRSFVATVVTVGSALLGLALGNTVLAVVSGFVDIPSVAPTIAIMLGLGAGVDYALFLVARFRTRLRAGDDVVTAARTANSTTGTAIITAGAIVVVSICGLYVTGITIIGRMGLAAAIVVAVAAVTTVVLVPAALRLAGRRVLPKAERTLPEGTVIGEAEGKEGSRARALATAVARRPWVTAIVSTGVLLVLAAPSLNLQLGQPDDSNRPAGDTMRVAYDRLSDGFGPGFNGPLLVAVDLSTVQDPQATSQAVVSNLQAEPGVAAVAPPQLNPAGDTAVVTVIPTTAPQAQETSDLVDRLREEVLPSTLQGTGSTAYIGGQTATYDDLASEVGQSLVLLVIVVVGLSLILLAIAFRSLWLPVVSAILNLLSIGAAYGVVTLAFQTELGTSLVGVAEQPGGLIRPNVDVRHPVRAEHGLQRLPALRGTRRAGGGVQREGSRPPRCGPHGRPDHHRGRDHDACVPGLHVHQRD